MSAAYVHVYTGATDPYGLAESLRKNPRDEQTLLVYADWLEENGRPVMAAINRHTARPDVFPMVEAFSSRVFDVERGDHPDTMYLIDWRRSKESVK